jgi:hypothetical protein
MGGEPQEIDDCVLRCACIGIATGFMEYFPISCPVRCMKRLIIVLETLKLILA